MPSRRFALLAGVLVALNLALLLAPQGLALRRAVINQLFGSHLVRAEAIDCTAGTCTDTRIDRGVIAQPTDSTQVTLVEADGRTQTIGLSTTTRVYGLGRVFPLSALAPGWRVLVTWPANGSATTVKVEHRVPASGGSHGKGHSG
jgi:hypothetical protein